MLTSVEITCQGTVQVQSITHTICRIGSHASMELCMPGIEEHAVTLRVQNNARLIYNRSTKAITINGRTLEPGQTTQWHGNQVLELSSGVRLRLLNVKEESNHDQTAAAHLAAAGSNKSNADRSTQKTGQRQVIAGFFLVFGTIVFGSGAATERSADKEFSQLVQALTEAEQRPNSGRYREMRVDLQNAFLRPDIKQRYRRKLRHILLFAPRESGAVLDEQVQRFVDRYL